jgi:hypothetical protein
MFTLHAYAYGLHDDDDDDDDDNACIRLFAINKQNNYATILITGAETYTIARVWHTIASTASQENNRQCTQHQPDTAFIRKW